MMKFIFKSSIALLTVLLFVSCYRDKKEPNIRYMPDTDMYKAVSYETYATNPVFKNGLEAQAPVVGTIHRGEIPYEYPNTSEGYDSAKVNLKSPLKVSDKNLKQGKHLFNIYCAICHGLNGNGQGTLVKRGKFLGVPNYKDRDITEGSIYHVIMYGRNMMGSHASQLNYKERWQIVQYVQHLRNDLLK